MVESQPKERPEGQLHFDRFLPSQERHRFLRLGGRFAMSSMSRSAPRCGSRSKACRRWFQLDSGFYVTDDTCTHGEASLSDGFVEGDEIECPWHSGKFCIKDGKATAFPAIEPIRVYRTRVVDGRVCIEAAQASAWVEGRLERGTLRVLPHIGGSIEESHGHRRNLLHRERPGLAASLVQAAPGH
jgi:nitrite reductase/ring-hydroxylating ferredoxin subunit